jgi:hypothetical protein
MDLLLNQVDGENICGDLMNEIVARGEQILFDKRVARELVPVTLEWTRLRLLNVINVHPTP